MRYSPSSEGSVSFSTSRAVKLLTGTRWPPRTISSSWKRTVSPSRVCRRSNSIASAPRDSAQSRLSRVFSRARRGAPRCPTIQTGWGVFHSLGGTGRFYFEKQVVQGAVRVRGGGDRPPDDEDVRAGVEGLR